MSSQKVTIISYKRQCDYSGRDIETVILTYIDKIGPEWIDRIKAITDIPKNCIFIVTEIQLLTILPSNRNFDITKPLTRTFFTLDDLIHYISPNKEYIYSKLNELTQKEEELKLEKQKLNEELSRIQEK